jgi:hypothetical protein
MLIAQECCGRLATLKKCEIQIVGGGDCTCTIIRLGWGGYTAVGDQSCQEMCAKMANWAKLRLNLMMSATEQIAGLPKIVTKPIIMGAKMLLRWKD